MSSTARFCDVCGAPVTAPPTTPAPPRPAEARAAAPSGPFTSKRIVVGTVGLALVFASLVAGGLTHLSGSTARTATSVVPAVPAMPAVPAALPPATTTVTGTLTLDDYETAANDCMGEGGYGDIEPGATVILTDESGKILGSSSLGATSAEDSTTCVYPFSISDVPTDAAQYAVEVTDRGKVVNSRQDLQASAWTFELTLGS